MNPCRIYLLDDHKIIRDGIRSILDASGSYKVAGEEGDPLAFLAVLRKIDAEILLLDISFPELSGFHLIPKIKKQRPDLKIVVLSMFNDPEYMQRALLLGAEGFVPKDRDSKEFLRALDRVRDGKTSFEPLAGAAAPRKPEAEILSAREQEILLLLANGMSSKEIAAKLSISTRTVETHRLNIMKKLGTTNSAETISVAARKNLI